MLSVKVKICGITNLQDAQAAIELGADLLGFNFYPESPRYVTIDTAVGIIDKLPGFVDVVGVFVNPTLRQIRKTLDLCQLNWIQLHGDEPPRFCRSLQSFNTRTIKAIRVRGEGDINKADRYFTDAILFDAFHPEKYGGTGICFDWNIVGHIRKRVFLAGGINPANAAAAIELGVYGIDVCSGVESRPGKKDYRKMKKLFENIAHLKS